MSNDMQQSNVISDEFFLNELSIDQLQQKMQSGEHTSRSICELYLQRIESIDKNGPMLNAVIELNPDALSTADVMDRERKIGLMAVGVVHTLEIINV